jgi:hypothetical protein
MDDDRNEMRSSGYQKEQEKPAWMPVDVRFRGQSGHGRGRRREVRLAYSITCHPANRL